MTSRKSIRKYLALDNDEKKAFSLFLTSYFKKRLIEDIRIYIDYIDSIDIVSYDESVLFDLLFPHKSFNAKLLDKFFNEFNKCLNKYIIVEWSKKSQELAITEALKLLEFFNSKRLLIDSKRKLKTLKSLISKYPFQNSFYYRAKYDYIFEYVSALSLEANPNFTNELSELNKSLDTLYVYNKLHVLIHMKNTLKSVNTDYDFTNVNFVCEETFDGEVAISVLQTSVELIDNSSVFLYKKMKALLFDNSSIFQKGDLRNLFITLQNALNSLKQSLDYDNEIMELYIFQIENKIIFYREIIQSISFINFVTISLRVKTVEWTEKFINKYKNNIILDDRYYIYNLCMAKCRFAIKDYDKAISRIDKIKGIRFKDISINLGLRRIEVLSYFCLEYGHQSYDKMQPERVISSFKKYLSQKKHLIPDIRMKSNSNFVNLVYRLSTSNVAEKKEKFLKEIDEMAILSERSWFKKYLAEV